ncbi:hypothetical protein FB560_2900 [Microbacterium saperdae]|uniref:Uncharacterized protein n=1 Tax=Microbacterium saperdae TaxID=69368 RepID=A0A543BQX9_9MICO|nr:hypothetical protein FB560_2900 [Microbacterium saperdae]
MNGSTCDAHVGHTGGRQQVRGIGFRAGSAAVLVGPRERRSGVVAIASDDRSGDRLVGAKDEGSGEGAASARLHKTSRRKGTRRPALERSEGRAVVNGSYTRIDRPFASASRALAKVITSAPGAVVLVHQVHAEGITTHGARSAVALRALPGAYRFSSLAGRDNRQADDTSWRHRAACCSMPARRGRSWQAPASPVSACSRLRRLPASLADEGVMAGCSAPSAGARSRGGDHGRHYRVLAEGGERGVR